MMLFSRRSLLPLVVFLACAGTLPAQQTEPTGVRPAPALGAAAMPRPGDRVELKIWNEPEMNGSFLISETGEVILPRLGSVQVANLPVGALQDSLRKAYAVYLRNPSVEVVVLRRIGVLGEVRQPGIYLADLTVGLPEIIARAGGYTEAGNPRNIVIVRDGQRIRYGRDGDSEISVAELQSGDQVLVRSRSALARNPIAWIGGALGIIGGIRVMVESFVK